VCPSNDKLRDCAGYVQAEPLDEAIKVVEKHFNVNHGFHGLPQIRNP
jgi:hypothetical protein